MKKFLALTIVAGSALGIAATTTACNNDPIKSQVELAIRTSLGLERAALCHETFSDVEQKTEVKECMDANALFSAKDALISKVDFSAFEVSAPKDDVNTREFTITFKATMKKDSTEKFQEITGGQVKYIDGKWYVTDLVEINPVEK